MEIIHVASEKISDFLLTHQYKQNKQTLFQHSCYIKIQSEKYKNYEKLNTSIKESYLSPQNFIHGVLAAIEQVIYPSPPQVRIYETITV